MASLGSIQINSLSLALSRASPLSLSLFLSLSLSFRCGAHASCCNHSSLTPLKTFSRSAKEKAVVEAERGLGKGEERGG